MSNQIEVTREEFLKATKTREECWIFEDNGSEPKYFKREPDSPEINPEPIYIFDNGNGSIREFTDMKKYYEIWSRVKYPYLQYGGQGWSLWNTWKQY